MSMKLKRIIIFMFSLTIFLSCIEVPHKMVITSKTYNNVVLSDKYISITDSESERYSYNYGKLTASVGEVNYNKLFHTMIGIISFYTFIYFLLMGKKDVMEYLKNKKQQLADKLVNS
jgi:hypothetical protein